MIVSCSNCGARYAVDPLAIGPIGRTVQCARCSHRWFEKVAGPSAAPGLVIRPSTPGAALPAVIRPKAKFAWVQVTAVGVVMVALVAATLFAFRRELAALVSEGAISSFLR